MRTKFRRLLAALVCVPMLSVAAHAAEAENLGSITLVCESEGTVLQGMSWELYHVGSRTDSGEFVLEGDFADCVVDFSDLSASAVAQTAADIESYAADNAIDPLAFSQTDDSGEILFSDLSLGLYLLSGSDFTTDSYSVVSSPALVEVKADESGSLDITVYPKLEITNIPVTDSSVPDSSIPDSSVPDSSSPDSSSTTDSTSSTSSQTSTTTSITTSTDTSTKIPQTGQLWWPVPILSVAGLALITVGWRVGSRKENDE